MVLRFPLFFFSSYIQQRSSYVYYNVKRPTFFLPVSRSLCFPFLLCPSSFLAHAPRKLNNYDPDSTSREGQRERSLLVGKSPTTLEFRVVTIFFPVLCSRTLYISIGRFERHIRSGRDIEKKNTGGREREKEENENEKGRRS